MKSLGLIDKYWCKVNIFRFDMTMQFCLAFYSNTY